MIPLLNSTQICEYLSISYSRFLQHVREDSTFPARKIGGEWKCDIDELRTWVLNQPCSKDLIDERSKKNKGSVKTSKQKNAVGGWIVNIPN